MIDFFSFVQNGDNMHALLETPAPTYSKMTVRRALIVWMQCGQQNDFKYVCNYYHHLEALEEQMPMQDRIKSRLLEYNLLSNQTPSSYFLNSHFPNLYGKNKINNLNSETDNLRYKECVFNLRGFDRIKLNVEMPLTEIMETSCTMRRYIKAHSKSLHYVLAQFHDYIKKCKLENSAINFAIYIKKQFLKDELIIFQKMPKDFSFLDISEEEPVKKVDTVNAESINDNVPQDINTGQNVVEIPSNITAILKEASKKLLKLFPEPSAGPTNSLAMTEYYDQAVVLSNIIEARQKIAIDVSSVNCT